MTIVTAAELLRHPAHGWRYELVRGELRKMSPSGARHGRVAAEIVGSLVDPRTKPSAFIVRTELRT